MCSRIELGFALGSADVCNITPADERGLDYVGLGLHFLVSFALRAGASGVPFLLAHSAWCLHFFSTDALAYS